MGASKLQIAKSLSCIIFFKLASRNSFLPLILTMSPQENKLKDINNKFQIDGVKQK
jgi:hypothetical protein